MADKERKAAGAQVAPAMGPPGLINKEDIPQVLHDILVAQQFRNERLALFAGKSDDLFGQFLAAHACQTTLTAPFRQ